MMVACRGSFGIATTLCLNIYLCNVRALFVRSPRQPTPVAFLPAAISTRYPVVVMPRVRLDVRLIDDQVVRSHVEYGCQLSDAAEPRGVRARSMRLIVPTVIPTRSANSACVNNRRCRHSFSALLTPTRAIQAPSWRSSNAGSEIGEQVANGSSTGRILPKGFLPILFFSPSRGGSRVLGILELRARPAHARDQDLPLRRAARSDADCTGRPPRFHVHAD